MRDALVQVYESSRPQLRTVAARYVGDEADDVVQEAFLRVSRRRGAADLADAGRDQCVPRSMPAAQSMGAGATAVRPPSSDDGRGEGDSGAGDAESTATIEHDSAPGVLHV